MRYQLDIAPQIRDEMEQTANWYRETSGFPEVGSEWVDGLLAALDALRDDPDRFPLASEAHRLNMQLRELHYGSGKRETHRVLFEIRGQEVRILAIRHQAQRDMTAEDLGL